MYIVFLKKKKASEYTKITGWRKPWIKRGEKRKDAYCG